jgi:tripartite-type tricarboxylate transporter receptor subunit TctC
MLPPVHAQTDVYPSKPLRIVVPTQAGASPDLLARTIAHHLGPRLGQQVLVVNLPGGGSNIGHGTVAKAAPDGYTVLVTSDALSINDTLFPNLDFKSSDFVPVIQAIASPQVLVVNPKLPFTDVAGLIAYAKANPGKVNFGSPQLGTLGHLAGELMKMTQKIDIVHIPFPGAPVAIREVMAGNIEMLWVTLPPAIGQIQQGAVRALAVSTASRASSIPAVPTMRELGYPGYDFATWQGAFLPKGTPLSIANRLNAEINAIIKSPEGGGALTKIGFDPVGGTPEKFREAVADTAQRWGKVVREAGVKTN